MLSKPLRFLLPSIFFIAIAPRAQGAQNSPNAEKIFASRCAVCHGTDANGGQHGPSLVGNNDLRGKPVSWIRNVVQQGIPFRGMPAFDLSATELDVLAGLVHSFNVSAREDAVKGDAAAGEEYFFGEGKCATCHMVRGRGSSVGPDLSNVASEGTVAEIRESLLRPSARIAPGYRLVTVALKNGPNLHGFIRSQSGFEIALQDMQGQFHLLRDSEVSTVTEERESAMPRADARGERLENLIAYLCTLDGVKPGVAGIRELGETAGISFSQVLAAPPGEWLSYNGNLSGNRYSNLEVINTANVTHLILKWIYTVPLWQQFYPDTPYYRKNLSYFGLETTPLVAGGIMYGTGPQQIFALDAHTGQLIWKYSRPMPRGLVGDASLGSNRGAAILGDKLFMLTSDAHMIALNRITGQVVWETVMPEKQMSYGGTSAPIVVKDMVIAGVAGGDWGIRGFVAAYRASDGSLVWRRWTVPMKGDWEAKTWGANPPENGGAATWVPGAYDAETNTLYWTTGNPYPDGDDRNRPGDNLYSNCILALDADRGTIKWFYQVTPHDIHDWDAAAPLVLVNVEDQGKTQKLLLYANKNGFFYVFDRQTGQLLRARPFVKVNWTSGIGPDGRPKPLPENGVICPEAGTNYNSTAFSPSTHLYYFMALDKCDVELSAAQAKTERKGEEKGQKYLEALGLDGQIAWKIPQIGPAEGKRNSGVLATAGGLLFYADPSGTIVAADDRNGKPLWRFPTNGESKASPITYTVGGKQFVALAVGPNVLAFGLP